VLFIQRDQISSAAKNSKDAFSPRFAIVVVVADEMIQESWSIPQLQQNGCNW